jgi:hypothetical protein
MVAVPEPLGRGLEKRVLGLWGSLVGAEPALLDRDGFIVVEDHRNFAAERRATITTARGTLLLAAPTEKEIAAADPVANSADVSSRPRGIGLLHYFAGSPSHAPDPRVRALSPADRPLLDELRRRPAPRRPRRRRSTSMIPSLSGSSSATDCSRSRLCSTRAATLSISVCSSTRRNADAGSQPRSSATSRRVQDLDG